MKKLLAIFLAALMVLSVIPMTAFAKVADDDKVITDILEGEYAHLNYVKEKKYFKTDLALYTAFSLYDKAWDNYFTGKVDTNYAKTILLALIDRFEAEYENETFEEILSALKGAKSAADFIAKVDEYTGILDLASSSAWVKSLGAVNAIIKVAEEGNKLYEKYVEEYAIVLSCQAASVYYGDLLQYIADNCSDKNVVKAAAELKENITKSLDEARDDLIAKLADAAASDGVEIGIDAAMSSNTVTAVISTVYNTIGNLGNKLFNTSDKYQYMTSLAMIAKIEDIAPAYVAEALKSEDTFNAEFALSAMMTLRSTGEGMIINLAKVTEDDIASKLSNNTAQTNELKRAGAAGCAKMDVYRELITAEETYKVADVFTLAEAKKVAKVYDANDNLVATVKDTKVHTINDNGAFVSEYNADTASYVKVIVTFIDGCTVTYVDSTASSGSTTGGSTSTGSKTGIAGFFQSLIEAFKNLFANLFKKK